MYVFAKITFRLVILRFLSYPKTYKQLSVLNENICSLNKHVVCMYPTSTCFFDNYSLAKSDTMVVSVRMHRDVCTIHKYF